MVIDVTDMDKLNAMMTDPTIQPFKDKHTVIDPISVYIEVPV
jgi:hypothetical protein